MWLSCSWLWRGFYVRSVRLLMQLCMLISEGADPAAVTASPCWMFEDCHGYIFYKGDAVFHWGSAHCRFLLVNNLDQSHLLLLLVAVLLECFLWDAIFPQKVFYLDILHDMGSAVWLQARRVQRYWWLWTCQSAWSVVSLLSKWLCIQGMMDNLAVK